jgi:hypothetical protein
MTKGEEIVGKWAGPWLTTAIRSVAGHGEPESVYDLRDLARRIDEALASTVDTVAVNYSQQMEGLITRLALAERVIAVARNALLIPSEGGGGYLRTHWRGRLLELATAIDDWDAKEGR